MDYHDIEMYEDEESRATELFESLLALRQLEADEEYARMVLAEGEDFERPDELDPLYYEGDDDLGWVEDRDPAEYNEWL